MNILGPHFIEILCTGMNIIVMPVVAQTVGTNN